MGMVTLLAGLLLPWLGGTLWLIFIESRLPRQTQPNLFRQAGYGFFIGYAALFLAILATDSLTGTVAWRSLIIFLSIFAALGGIAVWFGAGNKTDTLQAIRNPLANQHKALVSLLVILISFHILFFAAEILTQPVYPWDAWFTWIYRAKILFFNGHLSGIVSPAEWAASTSTDLYSVNASDYPLFPSVVPFWSALSLGRWSETLINLPVLLAGIAMGLALYGQCRETGFSRLAALICCYILFSIPLFGTHIALAGYADIWMAGYVGLGYIAIMRGAAGGLRTQTILGFVMVMFSMLVKNEGVVWFIAAAGFQLLLIGRLRFHAIAALFVIGAVTVAFLLGIHHLELPFIGKLGIVDNQLLVPFIGSFELEMHNVWRPYLANFFTMGSWNLLWVLVFFSLGLSVIPASDSAPRPERRIVTSFIVLFFTTQLMIFGLTESGDFADRYTAINRLPLQFVPALIFGVASLVFFRLNPNGETDTSLEGHRVQS